MIDDGSEGTTITPSTSQLILEPPSPDYLKPGPSGIPKKKTLSPYDISPVPTFKKTITNRGRKASQATLITSSPYKDELMLSSTNKNKQNAKGVKKKVFSESTEKGSLFKTIKGNRRKKQVEESDSEDDEIQFAPADEDLDLDDMPGQKKPNNSDAACIFCDSKFSEDRKGELWIQCLMCNLWCHVDCAGAERDEYVCDYCHTDC